MGKKREVRGLKQFSEGGAFAVLEDGEGRSGSRSSFLLLTIESLLLPEMTPAMVSFRWNLVRERKSQGLGTWSSYQHCHSRSDETGGSGWSEKKPASELAPCLDQSIPYSSTVPKYLTRGNLRKSFL